MKKVVLNEKKIVDWVANKVDEKYFNECASVGLYRDKKIIAGVVFNMYNGVSVCMHVASLRKSRWLDKSFLKLCFGISFNHLKCRRVTGLIKENNHKSIKFVKRLGFVQEGIIRHGSDDGKNIILFGLLKEDCKFLGE